MSLFDGLVKEVKHSTDTVVKAVQSPRKASFSLKDLETFKRKAVAKFR